MNKLAQYIEKNWYGSWWRNAWLLPLWLLSASFIHLKRKAFLAKKYTPNSVPVIVVGNINIGGTGKTPLIIYLAKRAQALGLKPAIVSRGYGGKSNHYPLLVTANTQASECGDEPKLLQQRLGCPVVVSPKRSKAVKFAIEQGANIIFSDDGLQHYAMSREAEIIVVDGQRRFGNQWLLPIGPLREPLSRLYSADLVLVNGKDFKVSPSRIYHLMSNKPAKIESIQNKTVDAVSGIGNPERFYSTLEEMGAEVIKHSFADHYQFKSEDFSFSASGRALVMTEKDAVKCREFAQSHWWYLSVDAVPTQAVAARIDRLFNRLINNNIGAKNG